MKRRIPELLVSLPPLAWLVAFFFVPAVIIFVLAFKPADVFGGVGAGWTLHHMRSLTDAQYGPIYWRSVWMSAATATLCLLLGLPTSFAMARAGERIKNVLLLLVIVPFWTNFLIRVFAWKALLHPQGIICQILQKTGIVDDGAVLLYNNAAVMLVMVYTLLPFAILPLYAAAEKFDFALMDAARDLGASAWRAFISVFLPGVKNGIGAAVVMVFVSSFGMYVVTDIIGGTDTDMIGNKIAQRVQSDRNLPLASALSVPLLLGLAAMLIVGWWWQQRVSTPDRTTKEAL